VEHLSLECAASSLPAPGATAGGDWWDVIARPDRTVALVLGAVMGHGDTVAAPAGALASTVRAITSEGHDPETVMANARRWACGRGVMATMFLGLLDVESAILRFCSAGQPPPIVLSCGAVSLISLVSGPPLGTGWPEPETWGEIELEPGDTVVVYSEGLAGRDGLGPRLMAALRRAADRDCAVPILCQAAIATVEAGCHDRTVLAVKVR